VSTFGRQNRTNTGVAPAQIEVFACGLFAALFWPSRLLGGPLSRRAAEREGYVSTRTLRVVQCSAALNHMGAGRGSIQGLLEKIGKHRDCRQYPASTHVVGYDSTRFTRTRRCLPIAPWQTVEHDIFGAELCDFDVPFTFSSCFHF
jgi:hypothetical protein